MVRTRRVIHLMQQTQKSYPQAQWVGRRLLFVGARSTTHTAHAVYNEATCVFGHDARESVDHLPLGVTGAAQRKGESPASRQGHVVLARSIK